MNKKRKVIAIFLAYNAEKTLKQFWKEFPKKYFDECILVDDASKDNTFKIAQKLKGLKAYQNPVNQGYGGNLKRAVAIALDHEADIIVDIHPDGEYKPNSIPLALKKIKGGAEYVLGNRFASIKKAVENGMYAWKIPPIILLNIIGKFILQLNISDLHQGFRVYTRKLFEKVNFEANSNDYLFSFELLAQSAFHNIKVDEVPVITCYRGKKRGASLSASTKYFLGCITILFCYLLAKLGFVNKIFQKPKESLELRINKLVHKRLRAIK
jgi:glycosyltransferase involved in cell wall biosynthesis